MLTDERATPQDLYDELDTEFHFTCDLAAAYDNYKNKNYYSVAPPNSAFKHEWEGICFCNPPYSDIPSWLHFGRMQVNLHDSTIVWLLPCDGSTKWFHAFIWDKNIHGPRKGIQLRFLDKRYKFGEHVNSAKFATIVVVMTCEV